MIPDQHKVRSADVDKAWRFLANRRGPLRGAIMITKLDLAAAMSLRSLSEEDRDSDGTEGGDANAAPGPKPCQARAGGIAQ